MPKTAVTSNSPLLIDKNILRSWGAKSRTGVAGPENALIRSFVDGSLDRVHGRYKLTVFEEPKLESGFPDLVLVYWDPEIASTWAQSRTSLAINDLKLLQLLFTVDRATLDELGELGGTGVRVTIERLEGAGMIRRTRKSWQLQPLNRIFAVQQIIAVEAKMSHVSAGLDQAALNTWFAHRSWLLLPQPVRDAELNKKAENYNVEFVTPRTCANMRPQVARPKPVSYASWLFNEWVWRAEFQ